MVSDVRECAVDLATAPRDDLLALITTLQTTVAEQQAVIATLQQRVHDLERKLSASGGTGVPGTKPASEARSKATGKPRKRRPHGYARRRSPRPTCVVRHAADYCPHCATRLVGGWEQRRREVIDLPLAPAEVVAHVVIARHCPRCDRRIVPPLDLGEVVVGHQRLSARVVSLIATLREEGRLPVRRIQWLLDQCFHLPLSTGAIVAASARVAQAGAAAVTAIRDQIRASPGVHADETGWRETGGNGYVWTCSTATARYFVRRGRGKEVVDEVLGDTFAGVLSCDFYAAYHHYPGLKQRCWAHLLRDIHELKRVYPADTALATWAAAVHRLFKHAVRYHSADARTRVRAQGRYEQRLLAVCHPYLTDAVAVMGSLCRRIQRHLSELFVFVAQPGVPADNNAAERSLRHLVTARKISGGTRSAMGTATKMATATLYGTWRAQGHNPFDASQQLLLASRV
jgi:transposase